MSATDDGRAELARVFEDGVIPAATALRAGGGSYFPLGPAPAEPSYFVIRTRRVLERADFEWPVVSSPSELAGRLRELWADRPELLALIDRLVALAKAPDIGDDRDGSVPDDVYPMY